MPLNIALLGWGSLLWDYRAEFDEHLEPWQFEGPSIPIEFARVSATRGGALTLVIDEKFGSSCQVAFAASKRKNPDDTIADLRCREGTNLANIGFYFSDGSRKQSRSQKSLDVIAAWATEKSIDVVVWSDLASNFQKKSTVRCSFSVESAVAHLKSLGAESKTKAAEYVWRAPPFISTPLRDALQSEPWFPRHG